MRAVETTHPPGGVCFASSEVPRYGASLRCKDRLQVPGASLDAWHMGVLVAENLNLGLEAVMANPTLQWAWIMGDDHLYPDDHVLRLLDRGVDVIVPLCLNRYPPIEPTIVNHTAGRQKWLEELPTSGLYKLGADETCGDAGLLIRRSVLEALERPFYDQLRSGSFRAEDQAFVRKLQRAGFAVWVDCEHVIEHIGNVALKPVVVNGAWHIRLTGGGTHIVDIQARRSA